MPFNQILVSLKFGRAVTSDALVAVGLDSVIEGVHAQVEHPVVRVGVRKNNLVNRPLCVGTVEILFRHEMILVEVPSTDRSKVEEHQDAEHGGSNVLPTLDRKRMFRVVAPGDERRSKGNHQK